MVFARQVQLTNIQVDDSDGNEDGPSRKRSRKNEGKYKKSPLITDLLMDMAKSGQLVGGKKLSECDADVNPRDKGKFVSAMALVEELWTEEEVSSFDLNACHCDMLNAFISLLNYHLM